jgi:hypothetical protein
VEGHNPSGGAVVVTFIRLAFGGLALGFVGGLILGYWAERLFNETILVITLTISSCYLVYTKH